MRSLSSLFFCCTSILLYAQDFDGPRPAGSHSSGINISNYYNTNIQLTAHTHSGSHGILFNAYKSANSISGGLSATGNTQYAHDVLQHGGGSGAIMFYGNGGVMDFFISPPSTGAGTNILWGLPKLRIQRDGNIGIGTSSPTHRLEVIGSSGIRLSNDASASDSWMTIKPSINVGSLNPGVTTGSAQITSRDKGHLVVDIMANDSNDSFAVRTDSDFDGAVDKIPLVVKATGNVGIGITSPSEKLEVNGTIRSREVKVEASNWPDYVFSESYELPTLNEVHAYIKQNKHLPGIPSAEEVEASGVELGEMNRLLLEKVEELTLYIIRQEKRLADQERRISQMNSSPCSK